MTAENKPPRGRRSPETRGRRHLLALHRRRDHLRKRVAEHCIEAGLSYDRAELNALNWAIAMLEKSGEEFAPNELAEGATDVKAET